MGPPNDSSPLTNSIPHTSNPPMQDQVASDLTSTPVERKSVVIAASHLSQSSRMKDFDPLSSGRRRQSAVIGHELDGCLYHFSNLITDYILAGSWAIDASQAESILSEAAQRAIPPGLVYDAVTHQYACTPPQHTDLNFPDWFCQLGNTIADISVTNTPANGTWTVTTGGDFPSTRNGNIRPDFVLSSGTGWRSVLVVGEHQSSDEDNSPEPGKINLACYAEQVFFAQPFRNIVWGIWTSKSKPEISCWRFDRAGGIGLTMDFSSTETGLNDVVRCLHAFNHMDPVALGFFTTDISWNMAGGERYPVDEASGIVVHLNRNGLTTPDLPTASSISLQSLLFVAPGIVTRGTRVWKGLLGMSGTGMEVVVKYAWRTAGRVPEADLYSLAMARGVVGLSQLIAHDSYGDIHIGVRGGHTPIHSSLPTRWASEAVPKSDAQSYATYDDYMNSNNNIYNRLVFGNPGTPISDETLSPLAIARALLAAVIGHASLFFDGQILHSDVTPGNIISFSNPVTVSPSSAGHPVCAPGTQLFGSLIDLDYAAQTSAMDPSQIAIWTGAFPFVAINILVGDDEFQRYRHDLESFFYVLVWISCYYRRPSPTHSKTLPFRSNSIWPPEHPLCDWENETIALLAAHKTAYVVSNTDAFEDLLTHFQPGFMAFRDAARGFRLALWGTGDDSGECRAFTEGSGSNPEPMVTRRGARIPRANRIAADEVRLGVGNWEGYLEVRRVLEDLVEDLCEEHGEVGEDDVVIQ